MIKKNCWWRHKPATSRGVSRGPFAQSFSNDHLLHVANTYISSKSFFVETLISMIQTTFGDTSDQSIPLSTPSPHKYITNLSSRCFLRTFSEISNNTFGDTSDTSNPSFIPPPHRPHPPRHLHDSPVPFHQYSLWTFRSNGPHNHPPF